MTAGEGPWGAEAEQTAPRLSDDLRGLSTPPLERVQRARWGFVQQPPSKPGVSHGAIRTLASRAKGKPDDSHGLAKTIGTIEEQPSWRYCLLARDSAAFPTRSAPHTKRPWPSSRRAGGLAPLWLGSKGGLSRSSGTVDGRPHLGYRPGAGNMVALGVVDVLVSQ